MKHGNKNNGGPEPAGICGQIPRKSNFGCLPVDQWSVIACRNYVAKVMVGCTVIMKFSVGHHTEIPLIQLLCWVIVINRWSLTGRETIVLSISHYRLGVPFVKLNGAIDRIRWTAGTLANRSLLGLLVILGCCLLGFDHQVVGRFVWLTSSDTGFGVIDGTARTTTIDI